MGIRDRVGALIRAPRRAAAKLRQLVDEPEAFTEGHSAKMNEAFARRLADERARASRNGGEDVD